ncbi:hypothetical protein [Sutcliffiella halmapala]|nr:hypothetical protein [Sutcliffiella halmapala]
MDYKQKEEITEKEILACNEEIAKELFSKELHVIVTDGLQASIEKEED